MNRKIKFLTLAGILLALASFAVFATSASVEWNPNRFAPESIAPGNSANYIVTFINKGPSTINGTKLSLEIRGEAKTFVSVTQPNFPQTIKKGENVSVTLTIQSPIGTPLRVVNGTLALMESKPKGMLKDIFSAILPMELTFSTIPLPPDPGEMGKMTIEGIDVGGNPDGTPNGVRDDIDRYIAFTFPNSEKARMGLTQYAKEDQKFIEDFLATANDPVEQKRVTRENADVSSKAMQCSWYTLGYHENSLTEPEEILDNAFAVQKKLEAQFLNTIERQKVYLDADYLLGGTGGNTSSDDRTLCQGFGFDPDLLPN